MHHCEAGRADARRFFSNNRLVAALVVAIFLPLAASAATDPVTAFIVRADSLAQSGSEDALRGFVAESVLLAGAAVGQLLDAAVEAGDNGDAGGEGDNMSLADRVGRLYESVTGSRAPLDLAERYRTWTPGDRAERRKAKASEKKSAEAKAAGDLDGAVARLEEAQAVYRKIGDRRSEAVVWGSLGVAHWARGDMDAVLASYEKALAARRAIEDRILEGRTLNGLGSANYQKGRYEIAADFYRRAVDLRRRTGDLGGLGTSLTYLGNAYVQTGRLVDARGAYEEALEILGESGDARQRFEVTNSIGNLYFTMGRAGDAAEAYRGALEIALAVSDTLGEMTSRNNLASSLTRDYRYREALEELEIVRARLESHPDPLQQLLYYKNSGMAQLALGEIDRARDDLLAFLAASEKEEAAVYQIEALKNLGYLYEEAGASERALEYAQKAMALADTAGLEGPRRDAVMLAAQSETALGRYDAALLHWEAALERDRASGAEARVLEDEIGIANVLAVEGRAEEARQKYRAAAPLAARAGTGDTRLALDFGIAHTFEKSNPDSARFYYEKALSILEETRSSLGGAEVRVGYLGGTRRRYYEEVARYYAALARAEGDVARAGVVPVGSRVPAEGRGPAVPADDRGEWSSLAFATVERAKARGLLDLLEASLASSVSPAENAVLDSLYLLDPSAPGHREEQRKLEDRYAALREERLRRSAGRAGSKPPLTALEDIEKLLPKDAALLAYALGDTCSLLWAVDRKGHDLIELPNRAALAPEVSRLRDALTSPGAGDAALKSAAWSLYRSLVEPASERLSKKKTLIIVPDGFLFEIPYEVLLTKDAGHGAGWGDLSFLALHYTTLYAPSVSVYASLAGAKRPPRYELDLFALGDPDCAALGAAPGSGRAGTGGQLADLPFSRDEVEKIASSAKAERTKVLVGPAASEGALKRELGARTARIVHLAAHGLVDAAEPARSCIALSPDSASDDDGYFYSLEVLAVPIESRLVVLSACESARGRLNRSEGVVGLSRSFIGAGAGGVVASLWKVSDESTSALMKELYDRMIGEKTPAAAALCGARRALIENEKYAHPFHWSPFVVIGTDRAPW